MTRDSEGCELPALPPDDRSYDQRLAEPVRVSCAACARRYLVTNPIVLPWRCYRCMGVE